LKTPNKRKYVGAKNLHEAFKLNGFSINRNNDPNAKTIYFEKNNIMNDNEYTANADLIFNFLFSKANKDKTKDELIQGIKPLISNVFNSGKRFGKKQILNYLQNEINNLKNN